MLAEIPMPPVGYIVSASLGGVILARYRLADLLNRLRDEGENNSIEC